MPVSVSYPGVYVEEIPSGVRTITGVATSITAFVGRAARGPRDKAVGINSFADFERIYDDHAQALTGPAHHPIADVWLPALTVGHRLEKGAQVLIAGVAQGRPRRHGRIVHGALLTGRCRIAQPSLHGHIRHIVQYRAVRPLRRVMRAAGSCLAQRMWAEPAGGPRCQAGSGRRR